jgi:glycosyltransferase involved in cell wall biosynthesis
MAIRRFAAKRSLYQFSGSWPIAQLASRKPDWWSSWPEGKKFAFVLTHDVEGKQGLGRCHDLAKMEMRLGFRSSFNFVPEGNYETPKSLREFLMAHGFEVGVHDLRHDGKLYSSREKFTKRAARINQYLAEWGAVGFRSGFMLHNLEWLRDLNILYDASTFDTDPFEPQADGVHTIFPFWVDRSDGSSYVELPYTLPQDSTLFLLLGQSTIDTWTRKLDWVAQHGGLALLNAHPDYMSLDSTNRRTEYVAQVYEKFLEYAANRYRQEAWFALPRDVAAHVHQMKSRVLSPSVNSLSTKESVYSLCENAESGTPADLSSLHASTRHDLTDSSRSHLHGKRAAMVMFSVYPADPRPRRAAEALASKGMKVDLICLPLNDEDPKQENVNGINLLRVPIRRTRGSILAYGFQYSAFLLISAALLAIRSLTRSYDLVYVHNMPDILVLSALVPKLFGAKVILDLHDPMPELMMTIFGLQPEEPGVRLLKHLEQLSIALADSVLTVNQACAKLFTSRSCPSQKMTVVMNSPDESIFKLRPAHVRTASPDAPHKPFVIMYHGSLVERNGLALAVDALERIRELIPSAQLRIYGPHVPFLERVLHSARHRGLQEAVKYLGPKTLEQLVKAIEECDVGIVPNQRSRFTELNTPTRIFEFLALGKPVIAPRAGGISDYFDDGSLLFFELGNVEDFAQKVVYTFSHPAEVTDVVRRGQEVYLKHTWTTERVRLIENVAALLSKGSLNSEISAARIRRTQRFQDHSSSESQKTPGTALR